MIRLLMAALYGATVAGIVAWIVSGDDAWMGLVLPTGIVALALTPLVLAVGSMGRQLRGSLGEAPRRINAETAQAEGRLALARVRDITRTGMSINDQPMCDIELLVTPTYGEPYQITTRKLVDIVEIPRLQPESVVVVAMERAEPSPVVIVMRPPDDWAQLAMTDQTVRNVRTAPVWAPVPDANSPWREPSGLRRINPAFFVVTFLLGSALALIPAYPTIRALAAGDTTIAKIHRASTPEAQAAAEEKEDHDREAAASMFVDGNAGRAVKGLVKVAGGSKATSLNFFGSTASLTAPSTPGAQTLDDFLFYQGKAERSGPTSIQLEPDEFKAQLFDLDAVDFSLLPSLAEQALKRSGIEKRDPNHPDPQAIVGMATTLVHDKPKSVLAFQIPVDGEYYDAWFTFDMKGKLLEMRGGAPGSDSYIAEHGK